MVFVKPPSLKRGNTIAVVTPSWGGPHKYPLVFNLGLRRLEDVFGLKLKEFSYTRGENDLLRDNPELRARDINNAFADKSVQGIIASIGGDDSVRILPYLKAEVIKKNPKFFMGYSDSTTLLTYINQLGLVTFHGPSVMAGFAEQGALKQDFVRHVNDFLFSLSDNYKYIPYSDWTEELLEWGDPENLKIQRKFRKSDGWRFLQGGGVTSGQLFGGSIEILELLKCTDYWPSRNFWRDKILFFETSEEKPSIDQVIRMLRNYGVQGIFEKVNAILFGRARGYTDAEKARLDNALIRVIRDEFHQSHLPIISNMDFGHTDPQLILPLGVKAAIDIQDKSFCLLESPFR